IAHLKMSGALIAGRGKTQEVRFARAVLYFNDGSNVVFRDPRKFGRMWLVNDANSVVGKLGPEPLETGFTTQVLAQRIKGRKAPIKALLCDQNIIAGVGNLYADEALFLARIHPLTEGGKLSSERLKRLHSAIRRVLQKGIKNKGASIENYIRPDGNPGTAHLEFLMPRKAGELCGDCGGKVERITVRGRGTYFCPKCQKLVKN
ncbi:MAG: DNA-formamidopyrimidine glycosylase family protein, partial [Dehalococcoidales bacterium]|nr:DNA-formamidopyrimidine glycosylase family protein [Dehalococcoidales bacterium]